MKRKKNEPHARLVLPYLVTHGGSELQPVFISKWEQELMGIPMVLLDAIMQLQSCCCMQSSWSTPAPAPACWQEASTHNSPVGHFSCRAWWSQRTRSELLFAFWLELLAGMVVWDWKWKNRFLISYWECLADVSDQLLVPLFQFRQIKIIFSSNIKNKIRKPGAFSRYLPND